MLYVSGSTDQIYCTYSRTVQPYTSSSIPGFVYHHALVLLQNIRLGLVRLLRTSAIAGARSTTNAALLRRSPLPLGIIMHNINALW